MDKQALLGQRGYFQMVHGVTLKLMENFGDDGLDFRPQPNMRSARELFVHIYAMEKVNAEHLRGSKIPQEVENAAIPETDAGKALVSEMKTVAQLQAFASAAHKAMDELLASLSEEELQQQVELAYGTFPRWQVFAFMYDEHWHHRGQLYTYARLAGKEPIMAYSYEN
jgi:uncharacterized damage-inducible protein DinB